MEDIYSKYEHDESGYLLRWQVNVQVIIIYYKDFSIVHLLEYNYSNTKPYV